MFHRDAMTLVAPRTRGDDPQRLLKRRSTTRLPRTRGDRPATAAEEAFYDAAPPHARG